MKYTLSTEKILKFARNKLISPNNIKQNFVTVFVPSCFAEPDFVNRYYEIDLPDGEFLLVDRLEKNIIFEVAFSKTGINSINDGWEFLWLREAGEIINQK